MRKKLLGILVLFWLFVFTVHIPYHVQAGGEIGVVLDGNKLQFDVAPVVVNDRTLVPMRTIFEALGYNVTWQEANQTVVAVKDGSTLSLQMDSTTAMLNNQPIQLDVAPQIIGDRTLVPLRFIGESANCDVLWDDKTSTVFIEYRIGEYEACEQTRYKAIFSNGEWLFYNGRDGIYKLKADGSQVNKIGDSFRIEQANGNYLYGTFYNDTRYYKLDLTTFHADKILDNHVDNLIILRDYAYYQDSLSIYRMSLITYEKQKIVDVNSELIPYTIIDNDIYYTTYDDKTQKQVLIKKSILSNDSRVLYEDYIADMTVYNNELYYVSAIYEDEATPLVNKGIFKYNPKDDTIIQISSERADNIYVLGKCLFYQSFDLQSDMYNLYRQRLDGSYNVKIAKDVVVDSIIGNSIYFIAKNEERVLSFLRMNTDGSNKKDFIPHSAKVEIGGGL